MLTTLLASLGLSNDPSLVHVDWCPSRLIERSLERHEGTLTSTGSLAVLTGAYTGRAPKNRFIVDTPDVHDRIAWGAVNAPMCPELFDVLLRNVAAYLSGRDVYVTRGIAGASRAHARKFTVVAERASQALFARQMLVRPDEGERAAYGDPDFVVLAAPGLTVDPATGEAGDRACVAINLQRRVIVVAGTGYSGEIKKSIFSTMNYLLPVEDGVLPMHCSSNMDPATGETAVFFGLSGTGKTTLSADPQRLLIGDDEHGWAREGVFNIEGGCYAKCIDLSPEREPDIFGAIRFGSVSENVALDPVSRVADYADRTYTENTRCAYPIDHIPNALVRGTGGVPSVVIFLTADAFGVLPPLSRLDEYGAMYHFMTGFTSKVAGTEQGIVEPQPTFSALFGEPFMPLDPLTYATMLSERIEAGHTRCYLVNTGWTGGGYGTGHRISIADTRALVRAALSGDVEKVAFRRDERFGLDVPTSCPGVDASILDPRGTWASPEAYDEAADRLAVMFRENFARRYPDAPEAVRDAGPRAPREA
ncbi:phosphoenolpyruvate carboxykinase (ATP) [bacterium]|nr:phosphoenolpyruvate carboxykinase (ATP) [bacterium]